MSWADDLTEFASLSLAEHAAALDALWARGVSDEQIGLYKLGYLNRELPEGLPNHFVDWATRGDKLEDSFLLPLTTTLGEVRGFQLRHVARDRSGYSDYLIDRREACLFGLGQAAEAIWRAESVFLVEGAFDLFPVQRALPWVVATLTAHTGHQLARILRRIARKVWMGYDTDGPGRKGHEDFITEHGHDFQVYTVEYPKVKMANGKLVKDPGELWEAWGDAQMLPFIRSVLAQDTLFS